ncbi:MAG: Macrocin-O-methyltransferase (TylF) [Betaproteobacteria bacterium ADurb.Bin341]|nr:MAG: Macrocin-O-methyltransferase (TylF) [Betaproteobacteria bacterium ADurb.Bin341]
MSVKQRFKHWLYTNHPGSKAKVERFFEKSPRLRRLLKVGFTPTFKGWGMSTFTHTPWGTSSNHGEIEKLYLETYQKLLDQVGKKAFNLTQFRDIDALEMLQALMWRHYMVYWSAACAARRTSSSVKNLVECGVCDGLTSFFAMTAAANSGQEWGAYLYDAREGMRDDLLLDREKGNEGEYSYLNVDVTRSNLSMFGNRVRFNKGFIPDSFAVSENPDQIVWLHIDLNSATPTIAALEYFWDKMASGGVILFDDYSWPGYEDTKNLVLDWFKGKDGILLPLPTGQAMIYKD